MIEQCLERKDLKAADYHAEPLKHTVDLTVQEKIKNRLLFNGIQTIEQEPVVKLW